MPCEICGGAIKRGQFGVKLTAFVSINNPYGQQVDEPMIFEDGDSAKYAHYGCVMKRCPPALLGIHIGEPLR